MKLRMLINENIDEPATLDDLLNKVRSDCQLFLDEARGNLYRGIGHPDKLGPAPTIGEIMPHLYIRKDRRARDNKQEFNDFVDSITSEHIGFKMRSEALFTTTDKDTAEHYGDVAIIFPIGDFKFAWSPLIKDLYFTFFDAGTEDWTQDLADVMKYLIADHVGDHAIEMDPETLGNAFSKLSSTTQHDIVREALSDNPEKFFMTQHLGNAQLTGNGNEILISNDSGYYQINATELRDKFEISAEEFYEML